MTQALLWPLQHMFAGLYIPIRCLSLDPGLLLSPPVTPSAASAAAYMWIMELCILVAVLKDRTAMLTMCANRTAPRTPDCSWA